VTDILAAANTIASTRRDRRPLRPLAANVAPQRACRGAENAVPKGSIGKHLNLEGTEPDLPSRRQFGRCSQIAKPRDEAVHWVQLCPYFAISLLSGERSSRSWLSCHPFFPNRKQSLVPTPSGPSSESRRTGRFHRGWISIPACKSRPFPHPFRKFRGKRRGASRKASLVHRSQHPYCPRRSSARKPESQSAPIAREWPPILRGFRLSI
jgi:hypothetical protein